MDNEHTPGGDGMNTKIEVSHNDDNNFHSTYVNAPGYWLTHHIHPSGNVGTCVYAHHEDPDVDFDVDANVDGVTVVGFISSDEFNGRKSTSVFVLDANLVALRDKLTRRISTVRRAGRMGS